MYAFTGVLTALYERERTGQGTGIEVAMLDALGEWMSQPVYFSVYGGRPPRRTGARHASIAPYGPYATAGGEQVFLGLQNEREWAVLCEQILHRPDLVTDGRFRTNPDRVAHDAELTVIIEDAFRAIDGRPAHGRAGRGGHRERAAALTGGVRRAPAARGQGPVARGGHARRAGTGAAPAGDHGGQPAGDGGGPGARPAHRRDPRRAGLPAGVTGAQRHRAPLLPFL